MSLSASDEGIGGASAPEQASVKKRRQRFRKIATGTRISAIWGHLFKRLEKLETFSSTELLELDLLGKEDHLLLKVLLNEESALLSPEAADITLSKERVIQLLFALGGAAPSGKQFLVKRRFLEIIEAGNQTGRFRMPIPWVSAPTPAEAASPFQQAEFAALTNVRPLIAAFRLSLKDNAPLSADAWWGRIFLSAMIHGALIKTSLLCALPEAIASAEPKYRWLMLKPQQKPGQQTPLRRWLIDPWTRMLLVIDRKSVPECPSLDRTAYGQVAKLVRAYAKARNFEEQLPRGISRVLKPLTTRLHLHLPPWMVHYANDRLYSVSLPDWSWDRLVNPPAVGVSTLTPRERPQNTGSMASVDEAPDDISGVHWADEEMPEQLRELGGLLNRPREGYKGRVKAWCDDRSESRIPSIQLLGDWVANWLLKSGRGRRPKGPRTIYQMVNVVARRLVGQLGRIDVLTLQEAGAFIEIYQTTLEDTPSVAVRQRVARSLKSFHDYLVHAHRVPPLIDSGVFLVAGKRGGMVDANVVSLDTYFRALHRLRSGARTKHDWRVVTQLQIIAGLGFFASLRRSEAIGLSVGDFQTVLENTQLERMYDAWVTVNPNALRGLKTRAATRQVPFHLTATRVELRRMMDWQQQRLKQSGPDAPMFPNFVQGGVANSKDPRLDWITDALQYAADDQTLRFHHLRHSFATWTTLLLWLGEYDKECGLPDWFLPTEHDRARFRMAPKIREELLGRAPTNRRTELQVSALMGHSGLDITMGSYIHLADLLVGRTVRRLTSIASYETLSKVTGYTPSYIQKLDRHLPLPRVHRQATLLDQLSDRLLREEKHRDKQQVLPKVNFKQSPSVLPPTSPFQYFMHFAKAAHAALRENNVSQVASRYGLNEKHLEDLLVKLRGLPAGILRLDGQPPPTENELIELPVGEAQISLAKRGYERLHSLWQDGDPPRSKVPGTRKRLEEMFACFNDHWIQGSYLSANFASIVDARLWLEFLDGLAFLPAVIAIHQPSRGKAVPSATQQLAYWQIGIGLDSIDQHGEGVEQGVRGFLRVDVDLRRLNSDVCRYELGKVLYGLRFALALGGVAPKRLLS
jgi:integrase